MGDKTIDVGLLRRGGRGLNIKARIIRGEEKGVYRIARGCKGHRFAVTLEFC